MKKNVAFIVLFLLNLLPAMARDSPVTAAGHSAEAGIGAFLGEAKFEMQKLFDGERFPNVVVATDGTVVATWGRKSIKARRSEDGGKTWGPEITIANPGFHGGGVLVNEATADILVFVQDKHPPASAVVYRSKDHGRTWHIEDLVVNKDANGNVPSLHMSEHGITLRHGKHKGRLLRPARVYQRPGGYNTAIYSDDGGKHWRSSGPFPVSGTGEGAVTEMSSGHLYYSSRKHWFRKETDFRHQRPSAWSYNDGESWRDFGFHSELPDGPRYRGKQRRGSNYNGHFGMMCGLVRLPVEKQDILIYSNADTPGHQRVRMTVWASLDGGKSWPVKRLVFDGPSAYSSLSAGWPATPSEGWIYLQFEGGPSGRYSGAQMARFNLSWLLQGEKTGDGTLPEWLEQSR
jgi:sialidase-1